MTNENKDRLEDIKDRFVDFRKGSTLSYNKDMDWLIQEVEKLHESLMWKSNEIQNSEVRRILVANELDLCKDQIDSLTKERNDYQAALRKQEESYYLMQKRLVEDNDKLRADTDRWHKLTVEAPLCNKCGELFVSIPKMGINHICKESK